MTYEALVLFITLVVELALWNCYLEGLQR